MKGTRRVTEDELAEARSMLARMVKYCREDMAVTSGSTRLARLVRQVDDYLKRTDEAATSNR